jgi:hypothetical protein
MTTATSQTAVQEILARPEPNPIVLTVIVQFERYPGVEAGGDLWEERFTYRNDGVGVKQRIESLMKNNPRYEGVRLVDWDVIEPYRPKKRHEEMPDEF